MAETNVFDQAARYVARLDPQGILAWGLGQTTDSFQFIRWLDTRSVPFPGEADRTGDLVAHIERTDPAGQPWLIPVEFQNEPDPLMTGRLLEFLGRLWRAEKPTTERGDRFWLGAILMNLTGVGNADLISEWASGGPGLIFRVATRNISIESATETLLQIDQLKLSRAILPLIPLMADGSQSGMIEEWKRIALQESDSRRRSDYGALAIVFAEASDRLSIWKDALKEWNVRQSKQVLEWQADARVEGRAEGKLEGKLEGKVEGQRSAIIAILESQFQNIPADLSAAIWAVSDLPRLTALVLMATKATSIEQFRSAAGL